MPTIASDKAAVPRLLTIAGAGIEADLKTFTGHGCYGMTCITGLTAQNTLGVFSIYPVSDQGHIAKTLDAVFSDVGVDAIKVGMLTTRETVQTIVTELTKRADEYQWLVVDPVMVATSGTALISPDAVEDYIRQLLPLATVITPNIVEAQYIWAQLHGGAQFPINCVEDMKQFAQQLQRELKCRAIILKGGHAGFANDATIADKGKETQIVDIYYDHTGEIREFAAEYQQSRNTHGTGCTLASSIACNLARGEELPDAVRYGIQYVQKGISTAFDIGHGHGPLNHLNRLDLKPFVQGHFVDYLLNHPKVKPHWQHYINHPFTKALAKGPSHLPVAKFKFYLAQDYLYLKHYARAYSLAGFKSNDMAQIAKAAEIVILIKTESRLHVDYCRGFGLTLEEMEKGHEQITTFGYSRFILDTGMQNDWLALQIALAPCQLGYIEAAKILVAEPTTVREGNPYYRWIENYVDETMAESTRKCREMLEDSIMAVSSQRIEQLVDIFATGTKMECEFWTAALHYSDRKLGEKVDKA